jgi:hypothetical protein
MIRKLLATAVLFAGLAFAQGPVYELRTYTTADGNLDALIARFRNHTITLFNKHHMESVGYWVPQDTKNTLIYILKHPSRAEGEKNWAEFQADPVWQKAKADSEKNGPLAIKVDRVWMNPTDFSKLK